MKPSKFASCHTLSLYLLLTRVVSLYCNMLIQQIFMWWLCAGHCVYTLWTYLYIEIDTGSHYRTCSPEVTQTLNKICAHILFSRAVVSDSLQPHGLQHARLPCPSLSPRVCSNSCPWSQWCHPTIASSAIPFSFCPLSQHQRQLALHIRWPKYWSFSFSMSPSNEYSELISFRIDWFDLLAVQGILMSLLQYHSLKASILWCSAFFVVQSHLYMTTGKTRALTRRIFVGKVKFLLFNMLSRLVITFFSKECLLISWLQSRSAVIFGALPNKVRHCFHCFSIYLP